MATIFAFNIGNGFIKKYSKKNYEEMISQAGGELVWVERENYPLDIENFSGLLLPGGDDVDPSSYGEERDKKCGKSDKEKDKQDIEIIKEFLDEGKPILGVCRGAQILNVTLGGTLHQHIKKHRKYFHRRKGKQKTEIVSGTLLYRIMKNDSITVNTLHHQGVKDLGEGLVCNAKCGDIIEGIELKDYPFCIGVQWHPEMLKGLPSKRLLEEFIKKCE